jgi:hypothetical protein
MSPAPFSRSLENRQTAWVPPPGAARTYAVSHRAQRAEGDDGMSPLSAGYGVILPAGNAPRRWQADAILGKSLRTASP